MSTLDDYIRARDDARSALNNETMTAEQRDRLTRIANMTNDELMALCQDDAEDEEDEWLHQTRGRNRESLQGTHKRLCSRQNNSIDK